MTDVIERMSQQARGRTNPACTASRHTANNGTWKLGCRCPQAVRAHEEWKAEHRGRLTMAPPALDMAGRCRAERHDTRIAYVTAGCRCPEAVRRYEAKNWRSALARQIERSAQSNLEWRERSDRVKRITGGRLDRDPRERWRGANTRVDPINLMIAMTGGRIKLNQAERVAAVLRVREVRLPSGPRRWRAITAQEIADRLGITDREVFRVDVVRREKRRQRADRRAADAKWRAAIIAAGEDRRWERGIAAWRERCAERATRRNYTIIGWSARG